ncbi:MAG: hypothetical protein ABIH34_06990 [Nanoarchaeota archaeon]
MFEDLFNQTTFAIQTFSLEEAKIQLQPLAIFIVGIAIYGIFIYKFYRFLARKDIFHIDVGQSSSFVKFFKGVTYILNYLILFPLFSFFWFLVMSLLLVFLSKNYGVEQILLVAMALVGSIRVTAYYSEDLSKDLSKMIPFAMLGVFIVDGTYFTWAQAMEDLGQMVFHIKEIFYYLAFVIALEFFLRMLSGIHSIIRKNNLKKEVEEQEM